MRTAEPEKKQKRTLRGNDHEIRLMSPRPNKHQLKTEATRQKLIKAALRIFSRDGFEASRIDDIASEAGYTRGAFYAHFQAKEDLFFALLEEESRRRRERVKETLERFSLESERLHALRNYYATRVTDPQWSILLLEFKLYAIRHPKLRAKLAEAHRSIRTKMKFEGLEKLLPGILCLSPGEHELKKVGLEAVLNGLVVEHAYDPTASSRAEIVSLLKRLFDTVVGISSATLESAETASESKTYATKRSRSSSPARIDTASSKATAEPAGS